MHSIQELKVLHFLWSGEIGGAERALYQLVKSQQQFSKYTPAVAFAKAGGHYHQEIQKLGCETIDLNLCHDRDIYCAFDIRKRIQSYPIHHFHSAEITQILASILCRNIFRIYTHRGGIVDYPIKQRLRYKIVSYYLKNFFDGFSGNTYHACVSAAKLFSLPLEDWHTIYNGLDFELFRPSRSVEDVASQIGVQLGSNNTVIGTAAHLRDWKRIDALITACSCLLSNKFQLLIVGDGPDKSRLEILTHKLGLQDRTIFTGMQKYIGDYLALMDIFVLPSTGLESFGNAIVEAMSQGVLGIVFQDSGGTVEHIQDGETGFIVGSVTDLSDCLNKLIVDPQKRQLLGQNAKTWVHQRYTLEKMAKSYDKLYETILDKKQGRIKQ